MKKNKEDDWGWVLKFLKENTFLVTVLPILVTAILYLMAVFFQNMELLAWDIPIELSDSANGGKYFYIVASGLLFYFSMVIIPIYWYPRIRKDMFAIKMQRLSYKALRRIKRMARKKKYPKIIFEAISEAEKAGAELQKGAAKRMWTLMKYGLAYFVSFCAIFYVNMGSNIGTVLLYCACMALAMVHASYIFSSNIRVDKVAALKGKLKKSKNDIDELLIVCKDAISLMRDVVNEDVPIPEKDEMAKYIFIGLAVSVLVFFVSTTLTLWTTLPLKHDFWIYNKCGKDYAVVYDGSSNVVLKEAEIEDDHLKIYLNKQISLNRDGLNLEHKKFRNVEKVKE